MRGHHPGGSEVENRVKSLPGSFSNEHGGSPDVYLSHRTASPSTLHPVSPPFDRQKRSEMCATKPGAVYLSLALSSRLASGFLFVCFSKRGGGAISHLETKET